MQKYRSPEIEAHLACRNIAAEGLGTNIITDDSITFGSETNSWATRTVLQNIHCHLCFCYEENRACNISENYYLRMLQLQKSYNAA